MTMTSCSRFAPPRGFGRAFRGSRTRRRLHRPWASVQPERPGRAAWSGTESGAEARAIRHTYVASGDPGGLGPPRSISRPGQDSSRGAGDPLASVNDEGDALVVWKDGFPGAPPFEGAPTPGGRVEAGIRLAATSTFRAPLRLPTAEAGATIDPAGDLLAVAPVQNKNTRFELKVRAPRAGSPSEPEVIPGTLGAGEQGTTVGSDAHANHVVLFSLGRRNSLYSVTAPATGSFSRPALLHYRSAGFLTLALSGDGRSLAAWQPGKQPSTAKPSSRSHATPRTPRRPSPAAPSLRADGSRARNSSRPCSQLVPRERSGRLTAPRA